MVNLKAIAGAGSKTRTETFGVRWTSRKRKAEIIVRSKIKDEKKAY